MLFCPFWFTELDIEPDLLRPCCNTSAGALPEFRISIEDLLGNPEQALSDYFDFINSVMVSVQNGSNNDVCKGCDALVDVESSIIPKRDDVFTGNKAAGNAGSINFRSQLNRILINHFRYLCNCKCIYCDVWKEKTAVPGEILPVLERFYEWGIISPQCEFDWGGGESTLLPEFEKTAAWIDDKGFSQEVLTNAIKYSPVISRLLQKGTLKLIVSLDSGTRDKYLEIKGVDAFEAVKATLGKYTASAPDRVRLKYINIDKVNNLPADIEAFLDVFRTLKARHCLVSIDFRELCKDIGPQSLRAAVLLIANAEKDGFSIDRFNVPTRLWNQIMHSKTREQNYERLLCASDFSAWYTSFPLKNGIRMISQPKHFPEEQDYDRKHLSRKETIQGEGMLALLRHEGIRTNKPILELGSGTGELSIGLACAHSSPFYICSEPSSYFLDICRGNILACGGIRDNVGFCCLSTDDIDLIPSSSLSVLCMRATLHHIADIDTFFREAERVLAPGGCVIFDEPFAEGYFLIGTISRLAHVLARDRGITLSDSEAAGFDLLADVCERFLREDFDKRDLEDKHVFTPDTLGLIMTKYGLIPKFYRNQSFAEFTGGIRQTAEPGKFGSFWRMYMVHLLNLGENTGKAFDRVFADILPYIDKCSAGTMGPASNATGLGIKPF